MKNKVIWLLALLVFTLTITACGGADVTTSPQAQEPPQAPQDSTDPAVQIVDSSFKDKTITIAAGTTVVWTHDGNRPHTVTADDGSFDSSTLNSSDSFKFTFSEPGTYPYYCRFHGGPGGTGMSGTIIVSE
jgi:plastocyanin